MLHRDQNRIESNRIGFMLTLWPGFYQSRISSMNQVAKKHLGLLGTDMCSEFRGGSHCGSQIGWGPRF